MKNNIRLINKKYINLIKNFKKKLKNNKILMKNILIL